MRVSSASLRKNSYTVPCSALPPLRVTTLVVDPVLPPYSGGAVLVRIRNSAIASIGILESVPAVHTIYVLRAIEQKVVALGTLAVHRVRLALAEGTALLE